MQLRPFAVTEIFSGITVISRVASLIQVSHIDFPYFAQISILAKFLVGSINIR